MNELASFGVGLYEEDISILELNHKKIEEDEIVTGIIDGYYCLWHSAYKSYHVNHHIVFLEAFDNKIEVLDPFFNCNKYYIEYDQNMHIMIFKEGYNERKNIINNFSFSKEEYERNLCLFFDNIELICEHLLKCTPEFDGIQFFRNLKSIIFGKNNLIELIQNEGDRNKLLVKCKELTYCWNTFLNRLMYIVMTKKKQNDRLSKLTADIKKKEIDILRCL